MKPLDLYTCSILNDKKIYLRAIFIFARKTSKKLRESIDVRSSTIFN